MPLQFDIGFGDAVTPEPEEVVYPSMLSEVSPRIMAYPMVTMLAEKCAIMVELGFANSRMKDFFDVWTVLNEFDISEEVLKAQSQLHLRGEERRLIMRCPCALRKNSHPMKENLFSGKLICVKVESSRIVLKNLR